MFRTFIAAIAAFGLATSVFAADEATQNAADASAPQQLTTAANTTTDTQATTVEQAKVNINTATTQELVKAGFTKSKAKAIITYRKKHGDFKSVDELKQVKGFKKYDWKSWEDKLTTG